MRVRGRFDVVLVLVLVLGIRMVVAGGRKRKKRGVALVLWSRLTYSNGIMRFVLPLGMYAPWVSDKSILYMQNNDKEMDLNEIPSVRGNY